MKKFLRSFIVILGFGFDVSGSCFANDQLAKPAIFLVQRQHLQPFAGVHSGMKVVIEIAPQADGQAKKVSGTVRKSVHNIEFQLELDQLNVPEPHHIIDADSLVHTFRISDAPQMQIYEVKGFFESTVSELKPKDVITFYYHSRFLHEMVRVRGRLEQVLPEGVLVMSDAKVQEDAPTDLRFKLAGRTLLPVVEATGLYDEQQLKNYQYALASAEMMVRPIGSVARFCSKILKFLERNQI